MCQLTELGTLANPLPLMFVQESIIHFGTHASNFMYTTSGIPCCGLACDGVFASS
jgi:hypothetical protein